MRGLILDRNKFIVERAKYYSIIKRTGVIIGCFFVIGIIVLLNTVNLRGTSNLNNDYVELTTATEQTGDSITEKVVVEKQKSLLSIVNNYPSETYLVTKVVDGDTIYVSGIKTRIRLIGVDTPETVDSRKPVQCFGPEASKYLSSLILGKYVGLEYDSSVGDKDVYDRLLRYVYLDGESVNQKIILDGYGREASYGSSYRYRDVFLASQEYAKNNGLGLWSVNTCNGTL